MRPETKSRRKVYTAPRVRKVSGDEARQLLEDPARRGVQGVIELLLELSHQVSGKGPCEAGLRRTTPESN
jgi:hypothetical protein